MFATAEKISLRIEDHIGLLIRVTRRFTSFRPTKDTDEFADACACWMNAVASWDGRPFGTHLWTCARNAIITGIRARANQRRGQTDYAEMDEFVADLSQNDIAHDLFSVCPSEYKDILRRWLEGETYAEIAATVCLTERQVGYRISRAIAIIKRKG